MQDAIDLRRFAHLLAAARHGSLTRAAAELGVSQPALSKSLRGLEQALGVALLVRTSSGVVPTEAGEALVARGRQIDAQLRAALADVERAKASAAGEVVMGCGPSEATRLLPRALEALRRAHPRVRVTVLYGLNEALMPMVKEGEIELALSSVPRTATDPQLVHDTLLSDSACVVARAGHPLAERRSVRPAELAKWPFVLARRRELERRAFDELFLDAGLRPIEAAVETTSVVLMKAMALESDHLTFLPRELIHWEAQAGLLRALPVTGAKWSRAVGVTRLRRRPASAAVQALAGCLRASADALLAGAPP